MRIAIGGTTNAAATFKDASDAVGDLIGACQNSHSFLVGGQGVTCTQMPVAMPQRHRSLCALRCSHATATRRKSAYCYRAPRTAHLAAPAPGNEVHYLNDPTGLAGQFGNQ